MHHLASWENLWLPPHFRFPFRKVSHMVGAQVVLVISGRAKTLLVKPVTKKAQRKSIPKIEAGLQYRLFLKSILRRENDND